MKEEGMQELIDCFKKYKYVKDMEKEFPELFKKDINTVQDMIDNKFYDKELVVELESKYSIEIAFFVNLERENNIILDENFEDAGLQVLMNLRYRLYRIGVYRILKEKGKEVTKEIIRGNYKDLLELLK